MEYNSSLQSRVDRRIEELTLNYYFLINTVFVIILALIISVRVFVANSFNNSIYALITGAIFTIGCNIFIVKKKSIKECQLTYLFILFVLFPVRMYYSGGLEAPSLLFTPVGLLLLDTFDKQRYQVLFLLLVISLIILFSFISVPVVETPLYVKNMTFVFLMFFLMLQLYYNKKKEKLILKEMLNYEGESTRSKMVTTLCHEINNPLAILMGASQNLQRSKDSEHNDSIDMIKKNTNRISDIVKKIRLMEKENKIIEKDYSPTTKMYDLD